MGKKASPESQIKLPQSMSKKDEVVFSILFPIGFIVVIGLLFLLNFKQAEYQRVYFAQNALYFKFDFSPLGALFLFCILAVYSLSLIKEKYFRVALLFTVITGLGVWVFFSCYFCYINQDGIHRCRYFGNETISWNQVKQVRLDIAHPTKQIPRLVYTLVTDGGNFDLNKGTQSGSLLEVDKLLTNQGLSYYTGAIDSQDKAGVHVMNKVDQAILKRHYRFTSK